MVEPATWRMDPEQLEESVGALRDYMDEEGVALLLKAGEAWLPLLEIKDDTAHAHEWQEAVEAICLEGSCTTTVFLPPDRPVEPIRLCRDDVVDGLVLFLGDQPVMAIAGEKMRGLPKGLLHLEGADLSLGSIALAAESAASTLISLDVGGNENFSDSAPEFVKLFPRLKYLDISGLERLESLEPLSVLTSLKHLELAGCSTLHDLQPLAKLIELSYLDLSECSTIGTLEPLSDLPALSHLILSDCDALPDLSPLERILSLKKLDLSRCEGLESVGLLHACGNLQSLSLSGCSRIRDLYKLSTSSSLRTLDFDDEVETSRVLASCAVRRVDPSYVEQRWKSWLEVDRASTPTAFVEDMLPAFSLGLPEAWAVDAITELIDRAKKSKIEERDLWVRVFVSLRMMGDPACRPGVERALRELPPGGDTLAILGPALDMLGRVKATDPAASWANALADATLDPLLPSPRASSVAGAAVTYYARACRPEALEPWLDVASRRESAPSKTKKHAFEDSALDLDHDPAALSGLVARLIQKQPESPVVAQLVAALVGLARERPDSVAVEPLAQHFSHLIQNRSESASVARLVDSFTLLFREQPEAEPSQKILETMVAMVLKNSDHPFVDRLVDALLDSMRRDPPGAPVAKIVEMVDAAREAGLVTFARAVLDHPALKEKATSELGTYVESFGLGEARRAMIRGLVRELSEEDILANKPRQDVLRAIEEDLL